MTPATRHNNKVIILHIGRHKTGTTSIQSTMRYNHCSFKERGVLYPSTLPANHSNFFVKSFSDNPEKNPSHNKLRKNRDDIDIEAKKMLGDVQKEIAEFGGDKIIFSGEDACTELKVDGVIKMKSFFDTALDHKVTYKIILYTRNPLSRANSGIQQLIKGNRTTEEDAKTFHLSGGGKRYIDIYEDYAAVFGHEAITFRSFEQATQVEGSVVRDFLKAVDITFDGLKFNDIRANESISQEVLLFLSWLYKGPRRSGASIRQNREMRAPISDDDRKILYSIRGAKPNFLSNEERIELMDILAPDIHFLNKNFGIFYSFPNRENENNRALFSNLCLTQIQEILPKIDPELERQLREFLEIIKKR